MNSETDFSSCLRRSAATQTRSMRIIRDIGRKIMTDKYMWVLIVLVLAAIIFIIVYKVILRSLLRLGLTRSALSRPRMSSMRMLMLTYHPFPPTTNSLFAAVCSSVLYDRTALRLSERTFVSCSVWYFDVPCYAF